MKKNNIRYRYKKRYEYKKNRKSSRMVIGLTLAAVVVLVLGGIILLRSICSRQSGANTQVIAEAEENTQVIAETEESTEEGRSTEAEQGAETEQNVELFMQEWQKNHVRVKGIYVTGPKAGSASMEELIQLLDETELNSMVIDVKNDEGQITYQMKLDMAQDMGACISYIGDMEQLMKTLKEHKVYTIARIVCFKDPYLAANYPELALKKPDGMPVTDAYGIAWVNPYKEEVWEYLTQVALAAADIGFDEIQYDYVRFPIGEDADAADYGVDMSKISKQEAITEFLTYASEKLHEKGIPVTADVFGTIIGSETDVERVGQDYVILGETVDALCPMVYPSHYGNNVFGIEIPDAEPYKTVLAALEESKSELESVETKKRAVVRSWLQAFTANWVKGYISYGGEQIRDQIQAVYDAGYEEWILWNAVNRYSADGLFMEKNSFVEESNSAKKEQKANGEGKE